MESRTYGFRFSTYRDKYKSDDNDDEEVVHADEQEEINHLVARIEDLEAALSLAIGGTLKLQ